MVSGTWDKQRAEHWHLFMPPARPSKGEVSHYERIALSEGRKNHWVLLGATPEIRSIASAHRIRLTCIDKNKEVYQTLRKMVSPPPQKEEFICSEWIEDLVPNGVDIVFADGSINMLPQQKQEQFLDLVHKLLRTDGIALIRVHFYTPPVFSSPTEVFEWFRMKDPTEPVFSATRTQLDMLWVDPDTLCLDFIEFHRNIEEMFHDNLITSHEYQAYQMVLRYNRIKLYYLKQENFESWCSERFSIENIFYGNDYSSSKNHPLYVLRR
jgi:hypothetical protein